MPIDFINALPVNEFIARFGGVAEHSPWVAAAAAASRPFASRAHMIEAFTAAVMKASETEQLQLIRAHPDLANKAKLTEDSTREQAGAGLDALSPQEFARFTDLNTRYKAKFGFPFIFAVRGATKQQILASFEERMPKRRDDEFLMALVQVCRILRFRLEDRVEV